jgi:predicted permease
MKLILHPLIVWVILSLIGSFSASWVFAAMIMAALPPALNVFIFARHYETGVDRAAACVLIGNTFAIFTLTLWLALIKTGALPVDLWP